VTVRPCGVRGVRRAGGVLASATVGLAGLLAACGTPLTSSPVTITVFGAASLRDALEAAAAAYEEATGTTIVVATDSSTALRTQIEQGARVEVFLSADTQNPDALMAGGLVNGAVVPFAGNNLAIVTPAANPAGLGSPFDLGRPGLKIIAAGDSVPISGYAATLLRNLAALPGAPAGLGDAYAANIVSREDNALAVLSKVALGEGDTGIVYASDATASAAVAIVDIPSEANVSATYAGVVPTTALQPAAGRAFLDWLAGPEGQALLAAFGFVAAP
jgi:molybdate transport system substrate-binding protein